MLTLDRIANTNHWVSVNPIQKITFVLPAFILVLSTEKILIQIAIIMMMSMAALQGAKIAPKIYFKYLLIPGSFIILSLVSIILVIDLTNSSYLYAIKFLGVYIGVTNESVRLAVRLLFRCFAALSCLYFIVFTTPIQDIVYVLQKVRCPAIFIEMMILIYRFIFVFFREAKNIYQGQVARLGYRNFRMSIKSLGILSGSLFVKAYKQGEKTYQSMLSRGYQGIIHPIHIDKPIKYNWMIAIIVFYIFIIGIIMVF